jgi:hypothetical protein
LPWHTDFKTGVTWPLRYCHDIDYNDLDNPSDVKVPWELSRMQHLLRLGQAYWLTGDERYAVEFRTEAVDWCERNPLGYGVNWSCTMDVALRAISWVWAFHFFANSPSLEDARFRALVLRTIFIHGEFILRNVEYADVRGNHYLVDGVGLLFVASLFRKSRDGERWWQAGRDIVFSELPLQVEEDGVDFEQSTAYHRLVTEAFLTSCLLLAAQGEAIPAPHRERVRRMCEVIAAITKPNGQAPLLGDADDGRIQKAGLQQVGDHRYLVSAAAVAFEDGRLKRAAGQLADESFWLLGEHAVGRFNDLAVSDRPLPVAFPSAGWYVLSGPAAHVFIDAAEVGMHGRGGHGHNDILSFELFLEGMNVVTDCGAYLYTASREWRNRFRSTAFHNTVQVDDEELNRFVGDDDLWRLHNDAQPIDVRFFADGASDVFEGGHTGYDRLTPPVRHTRRIALDRRTRSVRIEDRLVGAGTRRLTWRAHLDPSVRARVDGDAVEITGTSVVWCRSVQRPRGAALRLEEGWVSPSYGVKVPCQVIVIAVTGPMPMEFVTTFSGAPE